MKEYITKAGDQWDRIAKQVYGNEMYADILMEHNFPLLDIFQFDAGAVLQCPDVVQAAGNELPPWRR